jgi:hypothetical protein
LELKNGHKQVDIYLKDVIINTSVRVVNPDAKQNCNNGETKMQLMINNTTQKSYADIKNERFSTNADYVITAKQRWEETYDALPAYQQERVDYMLEQAKAEFRRRNPDFTSWATLPLAEAKSLVMNQINIDATMQRQLDIFWVLTLLTTFTATKVVPIQVYKYKKNKYLAWDGQHTLMLLWLIATQLFEQDPSEIEVPVNVYQSELKSEMRSNFVSLNSKEGKKQLDPIDIWEQQVFGVRVDGSRNPSWVEVEQKQQAIEAMGFFVTSKKFGDEDEAGAITRLQEINKLDVNGVKTLMKYLALVGATQRPVVEKEMVMMANFFERCKFANVKVDDAYIAQVASANLTDFDADFSPSGKFWTRASNAYHSWYAQYGQGNYGRFSKEPVHGSPFLVAQLTKSCPNIKIPYSNSKSEFRPFAKDLF